jgi:hypothetical protein
MRRRNFAKCSSLVIVPVPTRCDADYAHLTVFHGVEDARPVNFLAVPALKWFQPSELLVSTPARCRPTQIGSLDSHPGDDAIHVEFRDPGSNRRHHCPISSCSRTSRSGFTFAVSWIAVSSFCANASTGSRLLSSQLSLFLEILLLRNQAISVLGDPLALPPEPRRAGLRVLRPAHGGVVFSLQRRALGRKAPRVLLEPPLLCLGVTPVARSPLEDYRRSGGLHLGGQALYVGLRLGQCLLGSLPPLLTGPATRLLRASRTAALRPPRATGCTRLRSPPTCRLVR